MSNPDWPGRYWRDQQDAGPGWRDNGERADGSLWDDENAGFWRSVGPRRGASGRAGRAASSGLGGGGRAGRTAGRRARREGNGAVFRESVVNRFTDTADNLKSRLGRRGPAGSHAPSGAEEFWENPPRRRLGRAGRGRSGSVAAGQADAWQDDGGRTGYRGARRAGDRTAGQATVGDGTRTGRTALRETQAGWGEDFAGTARIRPGLDGPGAGGGGGGRGGRGGRGGWDGRPLTRGRRFKRWLLYGDWWRHWTWKKALAVLGGSIAGFFLLCIGLFFLAYSMTPIPTAASLAANWQSSSVYMANGQLLGTFSNGGQTRILLSPTQIPNVMAQAMTAAEDRNFYHEGGISVTGLARATYDDLFGSGNLQGGSTITMQYAKNYYAGVNSGQNITTKLKEIFIAMKLARTRSKSWVMTNYLNTVPFGPTEYGLGAAAEFYFGVNLTKPHATLSISQAAMLAAMPNAPGAFDPNPKAGAAYTALVQRWKYVLANMVKDGNITQAQADAQKFPKITQHSTLNAETGYKAYLWQMVTQELEAPKQFGGYGLTQHELDTGGYKITTTFSMADVRALAHSVNQARAQIASLSGRPMPRDDWLGGVLENSKTGAITAVYGGPGYLSSTKQCNRLDCQLNRAELPEEVGSSFKPYVLATAVNQGMSVFSSKLNGYAPIAVPYSPANSATEKLPSLRYVPGGCTPTANCTLRNDGGIFYAPTGAAGGSVTYKVFSESGENNGPLAVNVATAISSDPAYEDLAHRTGINSVLKMAKQFGVGQNPFNQDYQLCPPSGLKAYSNCNDLTGTWKDNPGLYAMWSTGKTCNVSYSSCGSPTIVFGAKLTAVDQASTFATLADGGLYHSPHVIAAVYQGSKRLPSDVKTRLVLSKAAAADVDYALSFVNNYTGPPQAGTAEGSVSFCRGGIIGKTGTIGNGASSSDAWFVGGTPRGYALSVAMYTRLAGGGKEILDTLPGTGGYQSGAYGGAWPATIWNSFMTHQFSRLPCQQVTSVFPPVKTGFAAWLQVKVPKKQPTCKPGSFSGCQFCQGNGHGNGNGNKCPSPSPTSCGVFPGLPCNSSSPSPTPTCGGFGQPCQTSPAPSPSPTPTCSGPPGNPTCTSSPAAAATGAANTTASRASPTLLLMLACEEPTALTGGVPLVFGAVPLVT